MRTENTQKTKKIQRKIVLYERTLAVAAGALAVVFVLFAAVGVKYRQQKQELVELKASVSAMQDAFEAEKISLNSQVEELNAQIALKKKHKNPPDRKKPTGGKKTVYLTFDDGPSSNTPEILRILKENDVYATFFVINAGKYNSYMSDIVQAGHQIALHTYTHDYAKVYASQEAYFKDLQKISDLVYAQTGVRSNIIRFPGGTSNTVSRKYTTGIMSALTKQVREKGYYAFDWNVSSGDGAHKQLSVSALVANCKKLPGTETAVVLLHDTDSKNTTVEALPEIIAYYKSIGCSFDVLRESTPAVQHRPNN